MQTRWRIETKDSNDSLWYSLEITIPGRSKSMLCEFCKVADGITPNTVTEMRLTRVAGNVTREEYRDGRIVVRDKPYSELPVTGLINYIKKI